MSIKKNIILYAFGELCPEVKDKLIKREHTKPGHGNRWGVYTATGRLYWIFTSLRMARIFFLILTK